MRTTAWRCLFLMVGFSTGLEAQEILPYLQSPAPSSVWITWKTDSDTESVVHFGEDSLNLQNIVTGSCQILSDDGYDSNYYYHSVKLAGLEPEHYYYYRTITGNRVSAICRFRAQPPLGKKPGIYRFLILGDHQIINSDRYERLMKAAREKVKEKYGGKIEDNINLVINDGDQVDAGTLDQYEHVHFEQSASLSGNIPIMTTVGNHETYGSIGLPLYYDHFFYDGPGYKGIVSPGGENYYSYQEKNLVFIHLSSEHPTTAQSAWVQQIIDSVKTDNSVDWVISVAHRPIQAEQFVGDISVYIRDNIIPILAQTEKSVLHITGHHHLYARGQVRDYPIYHIISGAAAWDQYWGQSTEKDFDDEQKTIDYWAYQIATFDGDKKEMTVESYAIGSPKLGFTLDNLLIDSFYRKPGLLPPDKPSIITIPDDTITLPYTFASSPYAAVTGEPYNSVQFQVSGTENFSKKTIDLIRDFENLFGTSGSPDYKPVDINNGVDIFRYEIGSNKLPDGTWFIRTRHRDKNNEWSGWSDPVKFMIKESTGKIPGITTSKTTFHQDEDIEVVYTSGPGNPKDWIGIYKTGDSPGLIPSTDWDYVSGDSGSVTLNVSEPGSYFIAFFENDGYSEIADRIMVFVAATPVLQLNKAGYATGENIEIAYSKAPGLPKDWIGIYRISDSPGSTGSTLWNYTSGIEGNLTFSGLPAGYYFVTYFLEDGYNEACVRIIFSVGSDLAVVSVDKPVYGSGDTITVNFSNGPGTGADWIGILRQNAAPGTAPLVFKQIVSNRQSGLISLNPGLEGGDYFASLFINNSGVRISNKAVFKVESTISGLNQNPLQDDFIIFPSPTHGRLYVRSHNLKGSRLDLKVTSLAGVLVAEKRFSIASAADLEEVDLSDRPPGIYLISLRAGEKVSTKMIVLQ